MAYNDTIDNSFIMIHDFVTLSETQMRIPDLGAISTKGEGTPGNTAVCPPVQKVYAGDRKWVLEFPLLVAYIRILCETGLFL